MKLSKSERKKKALADYLKSIGLEKYEVTYFYRAVIGVSPIGSDVWYDFSTIRSLSTMLKYKKASVVFLEKIGDTKTQEFSSLDELKLYMLTIRLAGLIW